MNRLSITMLSVAFSLLLVSSPATADWDNIFGGAASDYARCVQQTSDGGYIIVGYTNSFGAGSTDVWLIKTDSNGTKQWDTTFGSSYGERAHSVAQTTDGGYIIVGETPFGSGGDDVWLIKTDSGGTMQWDQMLGGLGNDAGYSVRQATDGGYVIAGITESYGSGGEDVWLVKTDSSGVIQWDQPFGGTGDDLGFSVRQTSDGGYIVAGYTLSYGAGGADAWLIKTDASGSEQWNRTFGGTGDDYGYCVRQTTDGGYAVSGQNNSSGHNAWLIKTNSSGIQQWDRTYGGTGMEWGVSVDQTSDGGYIITGATDSFGAGATDIWLVKTAANGVKQWDQTFGGTYPEWGECVQQAGDGGYVIVGETFSFGTPAVYDVWLIKIDASELAGISLQSPADGAVLTAPPAFSWTPNAGSNNVFAVDLSYDWTFSWYWSTLQNMHQPISGESWAMPQPLWDFIPSGSFVYWRVRGADLSVAPLTIITGADVWWFYKL